MGGKLHTGFGKGPHFFDNCPKQWECNSSLCCSHFTLKLLKKVWSHNSIVHFLVKNFVLLK